MAVQHIAYKYRALPNNQQRLLLVKTFGSCRFLYNKYVELNNLNYAQWLANGKPKGQSFTIPIESTFKRASQWVTLVGARSYNVSRGLVRRTAVFSSRLTSGMPVQRYVTTVVSYIVV